MKKGLLTKINITRNGLFHLICRNLFYVGCIIFIVLLPFETRYTNIAISIMVLGWLMNGNFKTKWSNLRINRLGFWIFIFYGVCVISMLYSENLEVSVSKLETKISLGLIPFLVFSSSLARRQIHNILRIFIFTMLATALYCVVWATFNYAKTGEVNSFFYQWLTAPTKLTAIYFANYLCLAVLIMLFAKEQKMIRGRLRILLVSITILFILMLAALSVTGYLVCLGLVYGWVYFRRRFSLAKSAMILAACVCVFLATIWTLPYTNTKISKISDFNYAMDYPDSMWNTVTIRLAKWECAVSVIKDHPVLGVGIGDEYDALMESYTRHGFSEGIRNVYNEHNQYLAAWVSTGLPGLIALLVMIFHPLRKAFGQDDYLLTAFLVLMSFSFMTENFLYIQKGVLFFAFSYSILIKRINPETTEDSPAHYKHLPNVTAV